MSNKEVLLGSHVGFKAKEYLLGSVKETIEYNGTALMVFTGPPQNFNRKEIDLNNVKEAHKLMEQHNIKKDNLIVHAPYLINLGSPESIKRQFGLEKLVIEINRTAEIGSNKIVLHPGSSLNQDRDQSIKYIASGINEAFKQTNNDVIVCIETMAGKGSEIGVSFQELKAIIDLIDDKKRIAVCLDTCHVHEAGYDIKDPKITLKEFDEIIGLEYLKVIHLNDSKNEIGAKKDRHENIGYGKIGFDTLVKWVHEESISHIPKILETPYRNNKPIYKQEISNLINNQFIKVEE